MHITIMYYVNISNTVPFSPLLHAASVQLGPRGCGEISSGVEVGKQEEVQTPVAHNDPAVNLATDNEESALHCVSTVYCTQSKYQIFRCLLFISQHYYLNFFKYRDVEKYRAVNI